jgi:hypothetical protein
MYAAPFSALNRLVIESQSGLEDPNLREFDRASSTGREIAPHGSAMQAIEQRSNAKS